MQQISVFSAGSRSQGEQALAPTDATLKLAAALPGSDTRRGVLISWQNSTNKGLLIPVYLPYECQFGGIEKYVYIWLCPWYQTA